MTETLPPALAALTHRATWTDHDSGRGLSTFFGVDGVGLHALWSLGGGDVVVMADDTYSTARGLPPGARAAAWLWFETGRLE